MSRKKKQPQIWEVTSDKDKSKKYTIHKLDDLFTCTCPSYTYSNYEKPRFECKHITRIKSLLIKEIKENNKIEWVSI